MTFDLFVGDLRSALHYLYEPDQLRRSPLAVLLGVAGSFDAAAALQRILLDAVESLRPGVDEPPQSRAWRIYDALIYRYVRRFDRDVVADQLGISGRQFRREQRAALEALATQLWGQFHLDDRAGDAAGAITSPGVQAESGHDTASQPAWLRDLPPEKPAELRHVLQAVLELTRPLAKQRAVRLTVPLPDDLPEASVPQVALRHALLNLLGVAMTCAAGGELVISVTLSDDEVEIEMAQGAGLQGGGLALTEREVASLDVARGLAALAGGRLRLRPAGEPFGATLILPIIERIPVLVVEDNADTLQLFERYASGTRYCLTCTHEPRHALRLAREIDAQIIVLDVMMPEVDGWEILAQLRAGEDTAGSAVIVCTVLPQESLALGLGADAFLQKPVSREDFLAALDRQASILLAA